MKLLTTLISFSLLSKNVSDALETGVERNLQGLEKKYAISQPIFSYDSFQFDFEYTVSNFISDTMIRYELYDSHVCRGNSTVSGNDITDNDYLLPRFRPDLQAVGDGHGERKMKLSINIDVETIKESPIFVDFGSTAEVRFCVRFMNYNMDYENPNAFEVNFIETPVYLVINLLSGFQINAQVTNPDLVIAGAYQDSAVIGYLCDYDDNVVEAKNRIQGESVRVCVKPTPDVLARGGYLKFIDEFTFEQEGQEQAAILPGTGGKAANPLTEVACIPGSDLCAFETLLSSDFFAQEGTVIGAGSVYLQLGRENTESTQRRLQNDNSTIDEARKRPQDLLDARPSEFSFKIKAVPAEDWMQDSSEASAKTSLLFTRLVGSALGLFLWRNSYF
eukprot:scaffold19424_cov142-Cylindrotheca_fusiformis.AAC.3